MGGIGSGRYGAGPTVEASYKISVYQALREGEERSVGRVCFWTWTNTYSGEVTARITTIAHFEDEDQPYVTIAHHSSPSKVEDAYRVYLTSTDQPLGGRRWWFICPRTGWRVAALYLPNGARRFASARAYRLNYRSQRSTPRDRAIARAHKIRRRLGAEVNPLIPVEKPLRMRWSTFGREMERLAAAEGNKDKHLWRAIEALQRMSQRAR